MLVIFLFVLCVACLSLSLSVSHFFLFFFKPSSVSLSFSVCLFHISFSLLPFYQQLSIRMTISPFRLYYIALTSHHQCLLYLYLSSLFLRPPFLSQVTTRASLSTRPRCPSSKLISLSLSLSLFLFETNPELSSKNVDGHLPKRSKARVIEWLWNKFDTCQLNGFFKLAQPRPLSFLMGHPGPLLSLF